MTDKKPMHLHLSHWSPKNEAVEAALEALVRAGLMTLSGDVGGRINARIEPPKPKKMKPLFYLRGLDSPRHSESLELEADWHDVNQALGALFNDGYERVVVSRKMVEEGP